MVQLAGRAGALSIGMERAAAEKAFVELVSRYGVSRNVHFVYGNFLASDRPAEALEQFKSEIGQFPDNAHAHVQIAQELIKQGDFDGGDALCHEGGEAGARGTTWPGKCWGR